MKIIDNTAKTRKPLVILLLVVIFVSGWFLAWNMGADNTLEMIANFCDLFGGFKIEDTAFKCHEVLKGVQA